MPYTFRSTFPFGSGNITTQHGLPHAGERDDSQPSPAKRRRIASRADGDERRRNLAMTTANGKTAYDTTTPYLSSSQLDEIEVQTSDSLGEQKPLWMGYAESFNPSFNHSFTRPRNQFPSQSPAPLQILETGLASHSLATMGNR